MEVNRENYTNQGIDVDVVSFKTNTAVLLSDWPDYTVRSDWL